MTNPVEETVEQRLGRIEALLRELEHLGSPAAGTAARELVTLLLGMHGGALTRMIELVGLEESRRELLASWAGDNLISSVLMLHGLHPVSVETRVRQALDAMCPDLDSSGAEVELQSVIDGVVRLRLTDRGTGSSRILRTIIEQILAEVAPDARAVEWEGLLEPKDDRVSLPLIHSHSWGGSG